MSESPRKILVTSALPYANGSPHMGHLVEYIQTDIWVRFQKLRGHDCIYVCASDAHGTPIMLKARELGITPEELTEGFSQEFVNDFADFGVEFDNYHTTHSEENRELCELVYCRLRDAGHPGEALALRSCCGGHAVHILERAIQSAAPVRNLQLA